MGRPRPVPRASVTPEIGLVLGGRPRSTFIPEGRPEIVRQIRASRKWPRPVPTRQRVPQTAAPAQGWPETAPQLEGRPRPAPSEHSAPHFCTVRMQATDKLGTPRDSAKASPAKREISLWTVCRREIGAKSRATARDNVPDLVLWTVPATSVLQPAVGPRSCCMWV